MNYHLNQNGETVGVFLLEELCRRRKAGELTGSEFVWCEGMSQWQSLDSVLQCKMPGAIAVPPPTPKPKMNPFVVVGITAGVLIILAVLAFLGLVSVRVAQRLGPVLKHVAVRSGRPSAESALALASRPVPCTSNTLTAADMSQKAREFRMRQYLEGYQQRGQRNPSCDAEALKLIQNWIDYNYNANVESDPASLAKLSDELAANPACDDPLVLTVVGVNTAELHETVRRLERAVRGFEQSRHKAYPKFYATVILASKFTERSARVPPLDASARQLLKEAFRDGSILPEDQAEIGEALVFGWAGNFFNRNAAVVSSIAETGGKPFRWLALVLDGENEIKEAWKARGSGYANAVSPEGWKGFYEHLAKARKNFIKAWKLRPDLPLAPCRMIRVSMGDSGLQEMRQWFDRTVALQIDYPQAWSELRWGLRPRWFGNHDAMLALGVAGLNTRRFDTTVPHQFFDSVSDLESELKLPAGQHIYRRADIWPHLQEMYEGYIAKVPKGATQEAWRGGYAAMAYLAGKYDVARRQLEALNWQVPPRNLAGWGTDLSLMPLEVAARTSPEGEQIGNAEARRTSGNIDAAQRLYTELATATNTDERTRAFIKDRLFTLETERRLKTGEWVDFLPVGEDLPGWHVERGRCKRLPDGALEVRSDEGGHLLYSRVRVGTDFEVRGTFEVVQSSSKAFQAGLVMGTPQYDFPCWYAFRMKRNADEGDVASFSHRWTTRQIRTPVALNSETNSFQFRFQNGLVSASVDDKRIFMEATPPEGTSIHTNEFLLGPGAFNDMNDTVIRYRNVQVRKLTSR